MFTAYSDLAGADERPEVDLDCYSDFEFFCICDR